MPIDIEMLNPLGFLVRREPYPPEIELLHNAAAFLITMLIYLLSFIGGFHIACLSSYFALCVYSYCIYKNLEAINDGWEKRRTEEAQVEPEAEVSEHEADQVKEEIPSDSESESELEEGEIKEDRAPPLEMSDDSDEDLPPLIPAHRINYIEEVD